MGSLTGAYIQVWFAVFLVIPPLPSSSITLVSVPIFFPLSTDTPMYVCIAHLDLNLLGFVPRTLSTPEAGSHRRLDFPSPFVHP